MIALKCIIVWNNGSLLWRFYTKYLLINVKKCNSINFSIPLNIQEISIPHAFTTLLINRFNTYLIFIVEWKFPPKILLLFFHFFLLFSSFILYPFLIIFVFICVYIISITMFFICVIVNYINAINCIENHRSTGI